MQTTEDQSPRPGESDRVVPDTQTMTPDESVAMTKPQDSPRGDLINALRGFCMGAADTVPGVSGGTVALILGHYKRLVTAISQIDGRALSLAKDRHWRRAWEHIDGRFLLALGIGIGTGIACLSGLMHWLLDHRMAETFAVFFGLVIASAWIVVRHIHHWSGSRILCCLLGIGLAAGISVCAPSTGSTSLPYLFIAGSIAICAMILPGISGAFVLLLFGVYRPITGMIKNAVKLDLSLESISQMGVFAVGCLVGLLAFSRLLKYLLSHHQDVTMAALFGMMVGSLGKLWPLQTPTAATAELEPKFQVMRYVTPNAWEGSLVTLALLAIGAIAGVFLLERLSGKQAESG